MAKVFLILEVGSVDIIFNYTISYVAELGNYTQKPFIKIKGFCCCKE
jgi:hypothetical protein